MKLHIWKNLTCRIASLVINNNTSISTRPTKLRSAGSPTCTPARYAGAEPARPLPSASTGVGYWESARFQAVFAASSWFRQSDVVSSRPTALIRVLRNTQKGYNASRWTFLTQSENYLTNQANRCIFFVDTERSALCLPKFKNGEIASLYEYRRRLPKMHS